MRRSIPMENKQKDFSKIDAAFCLIKKHPFLLAAFLCFACTWFGYGNESFIDGFMVYGLCVVSIGLISWILYRKVQQKMLDSKTAYIVIPALLLFERAISERFMQYEHKAFVILIVGLLSVLLVFLWLLCRMPEKKQEIWILCLAAAGFILRFAYVLETDITVRQNDVGGMGSVEGHMGYICYLLQNHHLPDFDPTTRWQFYHPPLHHILSAIWMRFCMSFGLEEYVPYEALQILPLFYSCVILILSYKIMKLWNLKGKALIIPFALLCFFPYLIVLSGALNNDALSVCFIMGAVYNTIVWYRRQTIGNILKIALCIGLGMMTKLSAGLIAPAVALVFLYVLIQQRKTWWCTLRQYIIFGAICCPLGLWWGVRNYVKFGIPFNYIPTNDGMSWQDLSSIPLIRRFTDFSLQQMKLPFAQWGNDTYLEYNPTIGLHKMAMFGEETFQGDLCLRFSKGLLWVGAVLALAFFICFVISVFEKQNNRKEKLFLLIGYVTILGNFYLFCINYPYVCTMNFRYVIPCMLFAAYGTGIWIQNQETKPCKTTHILTHLLAAGVFLFAVFTVLTYGYVFFTKQ